MNADGKNEVNPYAPPSSDVNSVPLPSAGDAELAERGTRFVAQLVDGLLAIVLLAPAMIAGAQSGVFRDGSKLALFRTFAAGGMGTISGLAWLVFLLFQAYLITKTGQSIGKRWFKIKIVKLDGSPVGFVSGVLLRQWLFAALQYVPIAGVGPAAALADPLFIFRADRRCVHDFLAGTKVIQLKGAVRIPVA